MFKFRHFSIQQDLCAMKVGTDGVILGAWANGGDVILDVGTGTGLIALMMAQRFPKSQLTALDIDEGAVKQALQNVINAGCQQRVAVLQEQVQQHHGLYDAVVSNPPYFVDSLKAPNAQRNMARHVDTLPYAELMQAAWRLLKSDGELSLVVPFDYRKRMEDEATFVGFFPSRVCAVKTVEDKPARRFLLAFRKHPCPVERKEMTIGDDCYRQLTKDFYL